LNFSSILKLPLYNKYLKYQWLFLPGGYTADFNRFSKKVVGGRDVLFKKEEIAHMAGLDPFTPSGAMHKPILKGADKRNWKLDHKINQQAEYNQKVSGRQPGGKKKQTVQLPMVAIF